MVSVEHRMIEMLQSSRRHTTHRQEVDRGLTSPTLHGIQGANRGANMATALVTQEMEMVVMANKIREEVTMDSVAEVEVGAAGEVTTDRMEPHKLPIVACVEIQTTQHCRVVHLW